MKNFQLGAASVTGEEIEYCFESGRNVVDWLAGVDIDPEISFVTIRVSDDTGRMITILIPNNESDTVTVHFDPSYAVHHIAHAIAA